MKSKKILRFVSYLVAIAAMTYFVVSLGSNLSQIPPMRLRDLAESVTLAVAVYMGIVISTGYVWCLLLRAAGVEASVSRGLTIFAIAQFAKYIPGNIASQVGRVALAREAGMDMRKVVLSMTMELSLILASSCFIGVVALAAMGNGALRVIHGHVSVESLSMIGVGALAIPIVIVGLVRTMAGPLRRFVEEGGFVRPKASVILASFAIDVGAFVLLGTVAYVFSRNLFEIEESSILLLTSVFAFAMVAGLVTPGAPAGLGVREAVVVAVLSPIYGPGTSAAITILVRLVTMIGDLIAFLGGLVARRHLRQRLEDG